MLKYFSLQSQVRQWGGPCRTFGPVQKVHKTLVHAKRSLILVRSFSKPFGMDEICSWMFRIGPLNVNQMSYRHLGQDQIPANPFSISGIQKFCNYKTKCACVYVCVSFLFAMLGT